MHKYHFRGQTGHTSSFVLLHGASCAQYVSSLSSFRFLNLVILSKLSLTHCGIHTTGDSQTINIKLLQVLTAF